MLKHFQYVKTSPTVPNGCICRVKWEIYSMKLPKEEQGANGKKL